MWPHSLHIPAGEAAVAVGTDDDELAALLAPSAVPPSALGSSAPHTDLGLELHPEPPTRRGLPRLLPSFQHGTKLIGRCTEPGPLRDGLLRTLASIAAPLPEGHVRLAGLPLLVDGGVALAPADVADRTSHRGLVRRGLTPVYVPSVAIDPQTLLVHIPAPFAGGGRPISAPLVRWWLPVPGPDGSAGNAPLTLGRLVAHATLRLAPPWFDDELDGPGADTAGTAMLAALVELVGRLPPLLEDFA